MKCLLVAILIVLSSVSSVRSAEKYILFILDTSGSMYEFKYNMSKTAIIKAMKSRPTDVEVALRVFNQDSFKTRETGCNNSELILDFDDYDVDTLSKTLKSVKVFGQTPLAQTMLECEYDFFDKDKINEIVLITDGADTCDGDPCDIAKRLNKSFGIIINVIAIDMNPQDRDKISCISENAGGKLIHIGDLRQFENALIEFYELPQSPLIVVITDSDGEKISGDIKIYDKYGDIVLESIEPLREFSPSLPIGEYSVCAWYDGERICVRNINVRDKQPANIVITF